MTDHRFELERIELSREGRQRKDRMLTELRARLESRTRARRAVRTAALGAACVLGAGALTASLLSTRQPPSAPGKPPSVAGGLDPKVETTPSPVPAIVVRVVTHKSIDIRPCSATGAEREGGVCLMSDEQLLAALTETGSSYGLVRAPGRVEAVLNER